MRTNKRTVQPWKECRQRLGSAGEPWSILDQGFASSCGLGISYNCCWLKIEIEFNQTIVYENAGHMNSRIPEQALAHLLLTQFPESQISGF